MAANNLLTSQIIFNTMLPVFQNEFPLLMTADRGLEGEFDAGPYKKGQSVQVRRQNQYLVGDGSVATPQPELDTTETITINHQYNALLDFTTKEETLSLDFMRDRVIAPACRAIIKRAESDCARQGIKELYNYVGDPSTRMSSFSRVSEIGAKMKNLAMPVETGSYTALSIADSNSLKNSLQNSFNTTLNSEISLRGVLGRLDIQDLFESQSIFDHTAGSFAAGGAVTVLSNVASGASTITLTGFTASSTGVLKQGDLITIAGVQSVNPVDRAATGDNIQFVIGGADDELYDANGSGQVTVPVSPTIISDLGNALRNVSVPIVAGMVVTTPGSYKSNLFYCTKGLSMISPPLQKLNVPDCYMQRDPKTGLSIRISQAADIINDVNIYRMDMLIGYKWHPQYAGKALAKTGNGA